MKNIGNTNAMSTQLRPFTTTVLTQYNILDVCSPTRHGQKECVGKENTAVWGLCLSLFFKQIRMAVVWICFILPQRILLTKCALALKDCIQLLYTPGNRTKQAFSSVQHVQC